MTPKRKPFHAFIVYSKRKDSTNLWRSKIWRLFFLLPPPPEFERNPQQIDPAPNGNGLGHYEVLHEVRTIKIRDHRFDAKIIFVSD